MVVNSRVFVYGLRGVLCSTFMAGLFSFRSTLGAFKCLIISRTRSECSYFPFPPFLFFYFWSGVYTSGFLMLLEREIVFAICVSKHSVHIFSFVLSRLGGNQIPKRTRPKKSSLRKKIWTRTNFTEKIQL